MMIFSFTVELLLQRIIVLLTNGTLLFALLSSCAMFARDIDCICCFLLYHLKSIISKSFLSIFILVLDYYFLFLNHFGILMLKINF